MCQDSLRAQCLISRSAWERGTGEDAWRGTAAGELNKMRIRAEATGEIRLGNILAMMLSHGCDKVRLKPGSQGTTLYM